MSLATKRHITPYITSILQGPPVQNTPVQTKPAPVQEAYPKPVQDMMDHKINDMWKKTGTR